ncbi:GGDEF domain-containing protein [Rheinheimera tilapiae]|uniref:diguanylate cyclase n=1 Tax=Rheinheimera tilapiae TaxID=875043 RepID=A0ABV6B8W6_9GAMM
MVPVFTPDVFPCGCLVTTLSEQVILRANPYFYLEFQQAPKAQQRLSDVLTPASKIVLESFVMPMLLNMGHCEEIQLTIQGNSGERLPVLVNANVQQGDEPLIFWVINSAKQRDKLYQELVDLRNALEEKAERLELLSQTDELTGLLNRRAFISRAQLLLKQAHRHDQTCSFLLLDIDHFKQINDLHGHACGDAVLRQLGQLLQKNCREHDVLARIGGEEFAIICMDSPTDSAAAFAEKLLRLVSAEPIDGIAVTVSIGVATAGQLSFEQLYKQADLLLYEAKHAGRNRLVAALYPADI